MADPVHVEASPHVEAVMEHPAPGAGRDAAPNPVQISLPMMGLTWLTFGLLMLVLYKVAWKPILAGLDKREADIKQSLEEARLAREQYAAIDERRREAEAEADARARALLDQARAAAVEAAAAIEAKAREEAQILLENAQRELGTAQAKALAALRREGADLAVGLSRKILEDQLDEARGRALIDRVLEKV